MTGRRNWSLIAHIQNPKIHTSLPPHFCLEWLSSSPMKNTLYA